MSENTEKLRRLKIEEILPTEVVGIENMKETKSGGSTMSSHRLIHPWFARRPTTATRLAVLSSILPDDYPNDKLLRLMKIGPKRLPDDESLIDYIERKSLTEDSRDGTIPEHYGYDYPHNRSPTREELDGLHDTLRQHWDGDLPVILDPTSGSGTIPLESLRYGLPTRANELNPVAWVLNKTVLEYPKQVGNIREHVEHWAEQIDKHASEKLKSYFPSEDPNKDPSHYFCTYSIECPSCGSRLPLANKWWFYKQSSGNGHAIKPIIDGDTIHYQYLTEEEANNENFNPSEGTVDNADAECPTCTVVTEGDTIKQKFRAGEFDYEICGVKYKTGNGYE
jgi:adenine-specific DNA methylase